MLLLSDCILTLDGSRVALSNPVQAGAAGSPNGRVAFGFSTPDAGRLAHLVGKAGVVHTRAGIVVMRLKLLSVDATLNVLTAEPLGRT